jgi:predicted AAA+ superfamily ATPase
MERKLYPELLNWKNARIRKPLLLQGARQVGKTWLMKEFGAREYKKLVYINFDEHKDLRAYFEPDLDPMRIVASLEAKFGMEIKPDETLIVFDEIQECKRALSSLKYFAEDAPQFSLIAAGSLLGVAMHEGDSFPVGKVRELTLRPLSFEEFLPAIGKPRMLAALQGMDFELIRGLEADFTEVLKTYYFVGGMPEAVMEYAQSGSLAEARRAQKDILGNYEKDFSKHIRGANIPKVRMIWDSIPRHLAKENKKFLYRELKQGGRASEFEDALDWLVRSGLVCRVNRVTAPRVPLAACRDRDAFKIFLLDTGLLCAMADMAIKTFYDQDDALFKEFKGAISEQYVLQQLMASGDFPVCYWGSEGRAELDFIIQLEGEIIPIEVKSDKNKRSRSLDVYMQTYKPKYAIRTSLKNYGVTGALNSIPLYMIGFPARMPGTLTR